MFVRVTGFVYDARERGRSMSGKTLYITGAICLALTCSGSAAAQDEAPPVFEMSNAPPSAPAEAKAGSTKEVESASAEATAGSTKTSPPKPRTFALGVAVLSEHGLVSAVARLRKNHVAIDLSYGINPVVVGWQEGDDDKSGDFGFAMSWVHVDVSLVLFFSDDQKRFQHGLRFASVYDRITSFGAGLGWVGELGFERFALSFGAGLKAFPRFEQRVRDHFDIDDEHELSSFLIPVWLNVYFGINLRWYLF